MAGHCPSLPARPGPRLNPHDRLQEGWAEHKRLHKPSLDGWHYCTRRGQGRALNMPEFKWTGSLRPARIGPMRPVRLQRSVVMLWFGRRAGAE